MDQSVLNESRIWKRKELRQFFLDFRKSGQSLPDFIHEKGLSETTIRANGISQYQNLWEHLKVWKGSSVG